jgi:hypothetical protein
MRRIIGKTIIRFLRKDSQQAAETLQLCVGRNADCEAAIHAMQKFFECNNIEAVILIDANNAFNHLNRSVTLWNTQFICPSLSIYAPNCYENPLAFLYLEAEKSVQKKELHLVTH